MITLPAVAGESPTPPPPPTKKPPPHPHTSSPHQPPPPPPPSMIASSSRTSLCPHKIFVAARTGTLELGPRCLVSGLQPLAMMGDCRPRFLCRKCCRSILLSAVFLTGLRISDRGRLFWAAIKEKSIRSFFAARFRRTIFHVVVSTRPLTAVIHDMMPRRAHACRSRVQSPHNFFGGILGLMLSGRIE